MITCKDCKWKYNHDTPDDYWCYWVDTNNEDTCSMAEEKEKEVQTIMGYPVEDLLRFAALCKEAGIMPRDVVEIDNISQWCFDVINKNIKEANQRAINIALKNMRGEE